MHRVFCLLLMLFTVRLNAQTYNWAIGEGGIGNDAANGIASDATGNAYVTGNFAGSANFSGQDIQGNKLYDIFIAKYNTAGVLQWVINRGGVNNEQANGIRVKNGFIYICGFFEDSCYFGSQPTLVKGEADAFVAKFDLNGNLLWVGVAGGPGFDNATALDVDEAGNVYISGSYENSILFDTLQITTTNLFSESFIAKYSPDGQLRWAKSSKGSSTNQLTATALGNSNALYVTGFFGGNFKLDNTTLNSSTSSYDAILCRLDSNGVVQWMKKAGSTYEDAANALCTDAQGNVFMGGYFAGTASFDNNTVTYYDYNDAFVAKYTENGNNAWVRAGKGPELDAVWGLVCDNSGNVVATGLFESSFEVSGTTLTGPDRDVFIISYDTDGNLRWTLEGGGIQTDCGLGVAVRPDGHLLACGYYLYTCSFGNFALDYADANDIFLLDLTPPLSAIEEPNDIAFLVTPNPLGHISEMNTSNDSVKNSLISLNDLTGNQIWQGFLSDLSSSTVDLKPGMYFLHSGNQVARFVIQK